MAVAAGLVAAALVALAGVRAFMGHRPGGESPEAAVRELARAIDHEDVAGIVGAIAPEETRRLDQLLQPAGEVARDAGFTGSGDVLSGFDLHVGPGTLTVTHLTDDLARVDVPNLEARWEPNTKDLGPTAERLVAAGAGRGGVIDTSAAFGGQTPDGETTRPFLITVRQGGRWYVSLLHTLAHHLAEIWGLPAGTFPTDDDDASKASAPQASQASSPTEAVLWLARAFSEADPERAARALPPHEAQLVRNHRDGVEQWFGRWYASGGGFTIELDESDLRVSDLSDGRKKVTVLRASGTKAAEQRGRHLLPGEWSLNGLCLEIDDDPVRCLHRHGILAPLTRASGLDAPFVVVEPAGDGWAVSPMETTLSYAELYLPHLTANWLHVFLGTTQAAPADQQVELGATNTVRFNEAGFTVLEMNLRAGQHVAPYRTDEGRDVAGMALFDPHGDAVLRMGVQRVGPGRQQPSSLPETVAQYQQFEIAQSGTHRIVLFGRAGTTADFTLFEGREERLPASGIARGSVGWDQPMIDFTFTVPTTGSYKPWFTGTTPTDAILSFVIVLSAEDYDCFYDCWLEAGETYRLRVSSWETDPVPFELELIPGPILSIDGGRTVEGRVQGEAFHLVEVEAGVIAELMITGRGLDLQCFEVCSPGQDPLGYKYLAIQGPARGRVRVVTYTTDPIEYTITMTSL